MPRFAATVLFSTVTVFGAAHQIPTLRVVLDTDLGDDIDDTWALSALLQSPAVDLRLIVTDSYGSQSRANALAKFLRLAGRLAEVPQIAIGPERKGATIMDGWANASDLDQFPGQLRFDAAEAIIEEVEASVKDQVPLQLLVLSPSAAVAAAIRKAPWIAQRLQISAMGGSLWHGTNGTGPPEAEWNVRADMPSSRVVYPHVTTLCPLDVAGAAQIDGVQYQQLLHCQERVPVVKALLEMYSAWLLRCPWSEPRHGPKGPADAELRSSVLYDLAAATMLPVFPGGFMKLQEVHVALEDDGFTVPSSSGWPMTAGISWRSPGWETSVVQLLCSTAEVIV